MDERLWDCIVVGGGAAGLSAALVLGRARRDVLLVDAGRQSNLAAPGVGGLLGHDGTPPAVLYDLARAQLRPYTSVQVRVGEVVDGRRQDDGTFVVTDAEGGDHRARTVLLAPGMDYTVPDVPGMAELWGGAVFHCPFCHGWEVRDRPLAVYGPGEHGARQAVLLTAWSSDVVLLTDGPAAQGVEERAALASAGVEVIERPVARMRPSPDDPRSLAAVVFADGTELPRDAVLVHAPLTGRGPLAAALGASFTPRGTVQAGPMGATEVPGLFAAGDVAAPIQQVALAVAQGAGAAASVVQALVVQGHGMPAPGGPPPGVPAPAA